MSGTAQLVLNVEDIQKGAGAGSEPGTRKSASQVWVFVKECMSKWGSTEQCGHQPEEEEQGSEITTGSGNKQSIKRRVSEESRNGAECHREPHEEGIQREASMQ